MAATKYGSGVYGLADESSHGFYIASFSNDIVTDSAYMPNHEGEDIGVSFYNEQSTLTADGALLTTSTTSETLAAEVPAVANIAIGTTDSAVADWFFTNLRINGSNRDFQQGGWTAEGRPGITNP